MSEKVSLDLILITETPHAILVKDDEDGDPQWIPKSHVDYDDYVLVPGMTSVFDVDEGTAIELGFV